MRRVASVLIVVLLSLVGSLVAAAPAGAAVHTAADLAADCNDDGTVVLSGTEVYTGGTGVITRTCVVSSPSAMLLWLHDLTLLGDGGSIVVSPAGRSVLVVTNATVDMGKGFLQFTPGGTAGDPRFDDNNAVAYVADSTIRGSDVEIGASVGGATGGSVYVLRSLVDATIPKPAFPLSPQLRIDSGVRAGVFVGGSQLHSAQGIAITTLGVGAAVVLYNSFVPGAGSSTVHPAAGSYCLSAGNTPAVPCS